ncbi:MAG: lytic transglycosylase domain-containing protein [Hyphomicrobiaceae bacterium]|nr:lytic transglycosylase domain-containing protein [Hyphomicrobiaceae bacterium]
MGGLSRAPERTTALWSFRLTLAAAAVALISNTAVAKKPPLPQPSPNRATQATTGQRVTERTAPPAGTPTPAPVARVAVPKPGPAETAFKARVAALVAPIVKTEISASDRDTLKKALTALNRRRHDDARRLAAGLVDKVAQTLFQWQALRIGLGDASAYAAFLTAHPDWPDQKLLRRRMAQAVFKQGGSAAEIKAMLARFKPTGGAGLAALASAEHALGNREAAATLARRAWCQPDLPSSFQDTFLVRLGEYLSVESHRCRLEELLITRISSRRALKRRADRIRPVIALLPEAERAIYTARLSMLLRQSGAPAFMRKVKAADIKAQPGYGFQLALYHRRRGNKSAAWRALRSVKAGDRRLINRDTWWDERRVNALEALKAGKAKLAYLLVADARPETVNPAKDQAFFAGWLALRHLRSPNKALGHFARMRKLADGPLSASQASFWLGMTYAKLGRAKSARKHFATAAKIRDTFHGLLARERLGQSGGKLVLPMPTAPTAADINRLKSSDVLRALVLTVKLDLDRIQYPLRLFRKIIAGLKTEGEFVALAQIGRQLRDGQLEVRAGKSGIAAGHNLYIYSYPLDYLPGYEPLRPPVETAFMLGIARQESEFNTKIVSRAGARGVLQVMPITARHVCRDYKITCKISDLLANPVYNARIGSAYIADRMKEFGGSYILTLTGYNAGPGRTRQWLKSIGDPRAKHTDALDWIYRIPFDETRNYVQKVLANIQVYRARLGERRPLRLRNDMRRASAN